MKTLKNDLSLNILAIMGILINSIETEALRQYEKGMHTVKTMTVDNPWFLSRCEAAKVEPTMRQASKFYRGQGAAFGFTIEGRRIFNQQYINRTEV